jgi:hypothetical protein
LHPQFSQTGFFFNCSIEFSKNPVKQERSSFLFLEAFSVRFLIGEKAFGLPSCICLHNGQAFSPVYLPCLILLRITASFVQPGI